MKANPLPVVVIGGYLGAGKTTLVNHLLRQAEGRRMGVLVNDFGDVGIDADLIEGADAGVLSLAGGCLCCSFGDDLVGTVMALARRQPPPDLCLIELSGVALPAAVQRTLRLAIGIHIVGTLVLADAAQIRRQAADPYVGDTVRQQLADADWVLLGKPDLVTAAALQATTEWLAALLPQTRQWAGAATELPPELLFGWHGDEPADQAPRRSANDGFAARPISARPAAANSVFDSCCLPLPDGTDLAALGAALAAPGSGVLRAKGLAIDRHGAGQLLQVAGGRWAVSTMAVAGAGRLVLIGLRGRWDPQRVLQLFLQPP